MNFVADENFPRPSVDLLRSSGHTVMYVAEGRSGTPDVEVVDLAISLGCTLLTFDADMGTLAVAHGHFPPGGIVYFRLTSFRPETPARMLLDYLAADPQAELAQRITVFDPPRVRQRELGPRPF